MAGRSRAIILVAFSLLPLCHAADWRDLKAQAEHRYQANDFAAATRLYEDALAAAPSDSVDAANLQLDLGRVLRLRGEYERARDLATQALAAHQRVYGAEHPAIARALGEIGMALDGAGDYRASEPYLEQAAAMSSRNSGPDDPAAIELRQNLGVHFARAGDYGRARAIQEDALDSAERALGTDHPLIGMGLRLLAQVLIEMGDYPSAQRVQLRALANLEVRRPVDEVAVGDLLVTMGNGAKDAGVYKTAEEYFLRAATLYEKHLGANNTRVGGALDSLGQDYVMMGRFEDARLALNRALDIQRAALGPRHPWTGNIIQGLAKVEAGLRNYAKARDLYRENLIIWRETLGPSHPYTVVSLTLLAEVLARLGEHREALDVALEAAAYRRDDIAFTVRGVDERQALRYADLHTASMDTALALAVQPRATALDRVRVWDALIRSRALVLDEMAQRHRAIREAGSAKFAGLSREVDAARSRVSRVALQGRGSMPLKEYTAAAEKARVDLDRAEYALAQKSAEFRRAMAQRRAGYQDVRDALPANSALIAYRRYRSAGADRYMAFVLPAAGRDPIAVSLGEAAHIDDLARRWRAEIDRERGAMGRSGPANEQQYRAAALALERAVWTPVATHIKGVRRVFLVPDSALQLVNFATLPTGAAGYLAETGTPLHLLSAERDLTSPPPAVHATGLLALANPAFSAVAGNSGASRGAHSRCGDFARLEFQSLPASEDEVQTILGIWRNRGWRALELSGGSATESALKQNAAGKRVLHLATHGFFLDQQCPDSSIARENPLLRAGLALTGANRHTALGREEDDGVLTAEEAASLKLEDTEWVVLSGCDTGVGDVRTGEGVLGLRRAFLEAGARTLIVSLWPVGDRDASEWMTALYRARFENRQGTIDAIRGADLHQLRARRAAGQSTHPFYWGGFVAVGDWR